MVLENSSIRPRPAQGAEADLVARARGGDRAACEELAQRFRRPAFLLALQLLGNREDAFDVAQDALLRFFTSLHRFEAGRPVKPWLLAIVRNRARDLQRRARVRRAQSLDEEPEEGYGLQVIDERADPEADSRRSQLRRKLWQALGQMPHAQREILVLRDYQDLSYAEIAAVLSIPLGTVMSRLHRARRTLRGLLEEDYGPPAEESSSRDR
jgi:RNA polymerase sigma-70 factor (ECF subfamily)